MMAIGAYISYVFYIRRPYLRSSSLAQHPGLYQFLLNKWYFDELYDFLFVRPENGSATSVEVGDGSSSTASARMASRRGCLMSPATSSRFRRLPLPLRLLQC